MTADPVPALYFHPDQVEGAGRDLVGRRSAGESFLRGFLRHTPGAEIRGVTETAEAARAFGAKVRDLGDPRPVRTTPLRGGGDFTDTGCVFFPTPAFSTAPWLRQRFGQQSCSLVGITHTVSTRRIIEGLHTILSEPVEPWDAIICTSRAVRSVVERQFTLEAEYFRQRFGATRIPVPQLPVIPLGIDTADFAPLPGARARMRVAQGASDDAVVVMTMGRFSVVEKANPWPLFVALDHIARKTGKAVHLWITGWASRPEEDAIHREGAAALCSNITVRIIDGRDADIRRNIWAGADIFTLPSDSIQETFGLVPIEAMAAGLPVVMPDWDGFRDTVRHGETGFLAPTRMANAGMGTLLARRYADMSDGYLQYLTLVQAQVQIDIPLYAAMLRTLVENPDLRRRMGAAGQAHARATFDWGVVIPQYLALARELAAIRAAGRPASPPLRSGQISPIEVDPFHLYADYATTTLSPETILRIGLPPTPAILSLYDRISGRDLYKRRVIPPALALSVANAVQAAGEVTMADLTEKTGEDAVTVESAILYLAKAGIIRLPEIGPREGLSF